jgi:hypothetical protein
MRKPCDCILIADGGEDGRSTFPPTVDAHGTFGASKSSSFSDFGQLFCTKEHVWEVEAAAASKGPHTSYDTKDSKSNLNQFI